MAHCNVSLDDETRRQLQSMADANEHNPGNLAAMVRLLIRQKYKRDLAEQSTTKAIESLVNCNEFNQDNGGTE